MKVPISWLKEFVEIKDDFKTLSDKLVNAGFEVEEIIELGAEISNIVVGKILTLSKHPNADKLQICSIDIGASEKLQVVTGAQNVHEGDVVPVAIDGATLVGGKTIRTGALRGVESQGMLCSGEELGIDDYDYDGAEVDGILILSPDTPIGADIRKVVGLDEVVLDIGVTYNRADCNSILGIAREVAAVTGEKVRLWESASTAELANTNPTKVRVEDKTLCSRYIAKQFAGIRIEKSPRIIAKRLKSVGIRPINNIVDMTNYVLIELGQPMHAFDARNIDEIVVRTAKTGEKITALNDVEYELDDNMLVICDSTKPVAIAGVMGGEFSGINDSTTAIVLESANFARDSIRRTSRKLNLRSDSSTRFEKGIDLYSQQLAVERCVNLMTTYGWGQPLAGMTDVCDETPSECVIDYTADDIAKILGIYVAPEIIAEKLNALQIVTTIDGNKLRSVAPAVRIDISNTNDLAEEVIRLYGYDHIVGTLMDGAKQTMGGRTAKQNLENSLRQAFVSRGASEILTYSFVTPKYRRMLNLPESEDIALLNPIGEDLSVMRTTLLYSMLSTMKYNYSHGNKEAFLFEIANVYNPHEFPMVQLPEERTKLAIGMYGASVDFYILKDAVDMVFSLLKLTVSQKRATSPVYHPGRSAELFIGDVSVGSYGEVHPSVAENFDYDKRLYVAELDLLTILDYVNDYKFKFKSVSKFPSSERDVAVTVSDTVPSADISDYVMTLGIEHLDSAHVFDVYQGAQIKKGLKSVAVRLTFVADKTLTDEFVSSKTQVVLDSLNEKYNAIIRS